ncbi:MAG: tetratricopeptide repeat protein, partial [Spirochaetota bacterium]
IRVLLLVLYKRFTIFLMGGRLYENLFNEALEAGKNRNYKKAVELFSRIVSETDAYPEALLYLGRSYHALGCFERAIPFLKYFIRIKPDTSAGYFFLGRTYLSFGIPRYAVRYLKHAMDLQPKEVQIYSLLGLAFLRLKKPEIAVKYIETAVQLDPENTKLYTGYINTLTVMAIKLFHAGDLELSRQMFHFIQKNGNTGILPHIYLAIIEKDFGNLEQALFHYNKAIEFSPDDHLLKFRRAALLYSMGKTEEAFNEYGKLKTFFPEIANFQFEITDLDRLFSIQFYQKQEYLKAIHFAKKVLHRDSNDIDMHLLIGECYRCLGELGKAKNHFLRAVEKDKNRLESRYGLSMVLWLQEKYEEMLNELEKIDRIDTGNKISSYYSTLCLCKLNYPTDETIPAVQFEIRNSGPDPYLMNALGEEYLKASLPALAEKWFNKTIRIISDHKAAHLGLIRVFIDQNLRDKAIEAYRHYLTLYQDDNAVRKDYVQVLISFKDYSSAIAEILKIIPFERKDKKLQRLLAFCYRETGEYCDAAIIYRQLLRDEPSNEEYLRSLVYCYDKEGNRKDAIYFLDKAFTHVKPSSSLLLILGVLLYKEGDPEKALKAFRRVLTISKGDWRAYKNIGLIYKKMGIDFAERFLAQAEYYKKLALKK